MKVIQIEAKVCLSSEEQMEAEEKYDLGNISKSKDWVWRKMGLELAEVWRIIEYDRGKSIIITFEEEKILVKEPFESLYIRWEQMKETETNSIPTKATLDTQEEEEDEDD